MSRAYAADFRRLERMRFEFGPGMGRERRALIARLARARFGRAADLAGFHESLLVARAYPDDGATRRAAERALRAFPARRDLRALRATLAGSGIAGTDIPFRFFAATALRLAARWPRRLRFDWSEEDELPRLEELLPLVAAESEIPALDEWDLGLRGWLDRMRGPRTGDAAFFVRRLAERVRDPFLFEKLVDGIDAPMRLDWGPGGPSRTLERWPASPVVPCARPLRRARPDLAAELARPPLSVKPLSRRDGERMVELARDAMVTRGRDLDVFAYADPDDVRMVDCGEGLQFACMGAIPERRLLLESVYGFITLKNGVPTGYVLTSALYGSAEIAYNVFETYRGGEAAPVYGRVLAMAAQLFGADCFTIFPYQLGGAGNEEGLASGAWWFYRKLGFSPRDRAARSLLRREEASLARNPSHRSSRATLMKLGEHNVYWHAGGKRDDVIGLLPLASVGLEVMDFLAARHGDDPRRGARECVREAAARLGGGPTAAWSRAERHAFARWAPLVLLLPGLGRWTGSARRAALAAIRAKGGRRETEFVRRFDAHGPLRAAVAQIANRAKA